MEQIRVRFEKLKPQVFWFIMTDKIYSSGATRYEGSGYGMSRRTRSGSSEPIEHELEDIINKTSNLNIQGDKSKKYYMDIFKNIIFPLLLTALSAFVRLYRLDRSSIVVWDEAHFGKFGSHYLKREFYFDVHPPLGKLLVGLSGYLANYDGSFSFESGLEFPENCNYVLMRFFNCMFGILCTPVAYKTAISAGFSQWTTWLITLMVTFEMISLTLSKFILLDSMLLFFTVICYYGLVKVHVLRVQDKLLQTDGIKWLFLTGIFIGCVCSVKWVGLFITVLIGLYTIYDLLIKFYQVSVNSLSVRTYLTHWIVRATTLIFIPILIYVATFKVHFMVLTNSGPGDGSISTLLQSSLNDNKVGEGPRSIAFGSLITLRSQGLSPNLLHSHSHLYPEGSRQQQITTYGYKDDNNEFLIEFDLGAGERGEFATYEPTENDTYSLTKLVEDGDTIRLVHRLTGCLLHSHPIPAFISKNHNEVSCYANLHDSDLKDEWVIEIQNHETSPSPDFQNESLTEVHPVSTNFRLRHKTLGCYLATTGLSYPAWGWQQGEVICKKTYFTGDKTTWWNIEDHKNDKLEPPSIKYVPPKPKFWKEFVLLNYGMMASNNALIPDPDKFDKLSSEWWEWPILKSGLRMCGWSAGVIKFFLIGHPFITWFSSLCLILFTVYSVITAIRRQRQVIDFNVFDQNWNRFLIQGLIPFFGWILHYAPFILMGRVTYLHHYVPALYFAIFVSGFIMEQLVAKKFNRYITGFVYISAYIAIIGIFWYLRDLSLGMEGSSKNYQHLKVLSSWMV